MFDSTIANLVTFATHLFQSIVLVPVLLDNWGKEKYGVWIVIYGFFSFLQVFDVGHSSYVGNEFSKYFHIDKKKAELVLGSGVFFGLLIGFAEVIISIGLVALGNFAETIIGIPSSFAEQDAKWGIVVLIGMWFMVGSVVGILVRIILPLGLMAEMLYISLIIKVLQAFLLFLGALWHWSILYLCCAMSIAQLVYSLGFFYYIYRRMPEYFPWWKRLSWKIGWQNLSRSLVISANSILEQFSSNGLVLVISHYRGPAHIPLFSTMRTVANTALQGSNMAIQSLYADLIRFHSNRESRKVEQVLIISWLLTGGAVNVGFLALQILAHPLYHWWTNGSLGFDLTLFNLLIFGVALANFNRGLLNYLQWMNHLRSMTFISISRFICLASISILGIQAWGLNALGVALVAAEVVCTYWALRFGRQQLAEIGGALPNRVVLLALLPVLVLGACFAIIHYQVLPLNYTLLFGLGGMILFYSQLFVIVLPELKSQIANFVKRIPAP
jgi:O-antigen/teichoic acid export membrane protein